MRLKKNFENLNCHENEIELFIENKDEIPSIPILHRTKKIQTEQFLSFEYWLRIKIYCQRDGQNACVDVQI